MSGATRVQQPVAARGGRLVAGLTAVWLVVCGIAGLHHDSNVAHFRDARGRLMHAATLSGHHDRNREQSDVHQQGHSDASPGLCSFDGWFHHSAIRACSHASSVVPAAISIASCVGPAGGDQTPSAIYRQAPKTSPPVARFAS